MGTRAYASAGLPGADWWLEGPVTAVEDATVAMDEVLAVVTADDDTPADGSGSGPGAAAPATVEVAS